MVSLTQLHYTSLSEGAGVHVSLSLHQSLRHATPSTEPTVLPAIAAKGKNAFAGETHSDISVIKSFGTQQFLQLRDFLR